MHAVTTSRCVSGTRAPSPDIDLLDGVKGLPFVGGRLDAALKPLKTQPDVSGLGEFQQNRAVTQGPGSTAHQVRVDLSRKQLKFLLVPTVSRQMARRRITGASRRMRGQSRREQKSRLAQLNGKLTGRKLDDEKRYLRYDDRKHSSEHSTALKVDRDSREQLSGNLLKRIFPFLQPSFCLVSSRLILLITLCCINLQVWFPAKKTVKPTVFPRILENTLHKKSYGLRDRSHLCHENVTAASSENGYSFICLYTGSDLLEIQKSFTKVN